MSSCLAAATTVCGCLLPAFATLASRLTVALSSPLGTVSSPDQGTQSPQKRRLTKPLMGVDLGWLGCDHSEAWMRPYCTGCPNVFIYLGLTPCLLAPAEVLLLGSVALFLFSRLAPAQRGLVRAVATLAFLLAPCSS